VEGRHRLRQKQLSARIRRLRRRGGDDQELEPAAARGEPTVDPFRPGRAPARPGASVILIAPRSTCSRSRARGGSCVRRARQPTGGYFWRPAYINHGAFASEYGCFALGRTDSKLFNHFHYNPWSTPAESADRSFARIYQRDPLLYKWAFSKIHNHPHGPEDFEQTMQRRGDEQGHDTDHASDGRRHDHWHGHHHHDHDSPHRHPLDGPDDHHHDHD
jgi:hypothetical protein